MNSNFWYAIRWWWHKPGYYKRNAEFLSRSHPLLSLRSRLGLACRERGHNWQTRLCLWLEEKPRQAEEREEE